MVYEARRFRILWGYLAREFWRGYAEIMVTADTMRDIMHVTKIGMLRGCNGAIEATYRVRSDASGDRCGEIGQSDGGSIGARRAG